MINFYKGKKVFVTGHTGFKGTWLCKILLQLGADVFGYSLNATNEQKLYKLSGVEDDIDCTYGDIRDFEKLKECLISFRPEIVLHLAAQPLVRESYKDPLLTYSTNVMGTVNLLEAIRACDSVISVVNVTTDKVYHNREVKEGYKEDDVLNGFDPYSNSKSCSELVTSSYRNSFFSDSGISLSTCRAGNVIGGGDFSKDRIIPDCYRAVSKGDVINIRNPYSVRPYQHVLDPLYAYLLVAQRQYDDKNSFEGAYNIGPDIKDNLTTGELVDLFCKEWGNGAKWISMAEKNSVHEAGLLYLNCEKMKEVFGWKPIWGISQTVAKTVEWYKEFYNGNNVRACMDEQIKDFFNEVRYDIHKNGY